MNAFAILFVVMGSSSNEPAQLQKTPCAQSGLSAMNDKKSPRLQHTALIAFVGAQAVGRDSKTAATHSLVLMLWIVILNKMAAAVLVRTRAIVPLASGLAALVTKPSAGLAVTMADVLPLTCASVILGGMALNVTSASLDSQDPSAKCNAPRAVASMENAATALMAPGSACAMIGSLAQSVTSVSRTSLAQNVCHSAPWIQFHHRLAKISEGTSSQSSS